MKRLFFVLFLVPMPALATYQATWINRCDQYGQVTYTLILDDDAGIRPEVRVEKNFSDQLDTPVVRSALALQTALRAIKDQDNPAPSSPPWQVVRQNLLAQHPELQNLINQLEAAQ